MYLHRIGPKCPSASFTPSFRFFSSEISRRIGSPPTQQGSTAPCPPLASPPCLTSSAHHDDKPAPLLPREAAQTRAGASRAARALVGPTLPGKARAGASSSPPGCVATPWGASHEVAVVVLRLRLRAMNEINAGKCFTIRISIRLNWHTWAQASMSSID
jgi:hypothetical protein